MRINKTDFETVMANSEFLDYYYQLFERNGVGSVVDIQVKEFQYLIHQQVAATIQKTASYSFFTQTYKLPQRLTKDYQRLAECTERLSKIEMDQLIPKQFIEQDFNVQVKTSQESQYEQLLNIMSDTFRQIKKT
ncbi:hypothetical protein ACFC9N_08315 [Enterococcus casseliflavus]|uniref:hypothetical protein n=1 Tax=Enterococcus casseliflavus TaxID=37734 RepID=UPI0039A6EECE